MEETNSMNSGSQLFTVVVDNVFEILSIRATDVA